MYLPVPPRSDHGAEGDKSAPAVSADEEADLRAVVGPNADFYLRSWRAVPDRPDSWHGFNRAAFFLGFFWLGYRRMHARAFALFGIIVAEALLEEFVFCALLGWPEPPRLLGTAFGFTLALVCGARANRWYLAHVRRVIADLRQGEPPQPGDRELLAARGGTDFGGGVAVLFMCLLGMFALGVCLAALNVLLTGK